MRLAVDKAKESNMPKDNIDRAIKRGTGELEGQELQELVYEGYAPNGVGVLIEVVTDNRNRAIAELRHALNRNGGSMAEAGAVAWQFERKGYLTLKDTVVDEDDLFLVAADAGADDVSFDEGEVEIYTGLSAFARVRDTLAEMGYHLDEAHVIYAPKSPVTLPKAQAVQVLRVLDQLEELDDVQNVYATMEITEEAIAAMEAA